MKPKEVLEFLQKFTQLRSQYDVQTFVLQMFCDNKEDLEMLGFGTFSIREDSPIKSAIITEAVLSRLLELLQDHNGLDITSASGALSGMLASVTDAALLRETKHRRDLVEDRALGDVITNAESGSEFLN